MREREREREEGDAFFFEFKGWLTWNSARGGSDEG